MSRKSKPKNNNKRNIWNRQRARDEKGQKQTIRLNTQQNLTFDQLAT